MNKFHIKKPTKLGDVLGDLLLRFLLNCPSETDDEKPRLFFHLEKAHWFYLDFWRKKVNGLPYLKFREFVRRLFKYSGLLEPYKDFYKDLKFFNHYKKSVPVCGCILLNYDMNKVLLVQSFFGKSWGFPRGKINNQESERDCAAREVLEEIGYDVSEYIKEADSFEYNENGQQQKFFIITNTDENFKFKPRMRKEIGTIGWHNLEMAIAVSEEQWEYFRIIEPLKHLQIWINKKKGIYEDESEDEDEGEYEDEDE